MDTGLVDCITSYLSGSKRYGVCGQFAFKDEVGYINDQETSKVVTRGTKRYLLIYVRVHHLCDALMQIAGRLGVEEITLPDVKLLDGAEGWGDLFFEWYAGHIVAAARTDSDAQFRYRVILADRVRHQAKRYATALGLDWDGVAHRFTPDYVLKDDLDILTRFALRDMGVESV